jgi:hypothetical protein
LVQEEQKR